MVKSQKNNKIINVKPQPAVKADKGSKAPKQSAEEIKSLIKGAKQEIIIALLERPSGATLEEMTKATNWQKHSIHGLMSGVLKKKLKLNIVSEKQERGRVYNIVQVTRL